MSDKHQTRVFFFVVDNALLTESDMTHPLRVTLRRSKRAILATFPRLFKGKSTQSGDFVASAEIGPSEWGKWGVRMRPRKASTAAGVIT